MSFLPFIFFSNFIYGNIPSVSFCLLACLIQQRALSCEHISKILMHSFLCAICLFFGIWFKPNGLIFIIGIEIIWITYTLINHQITYLAAAGACLIMYVLGSVLPVTIVSSYTGISFNNSTPKIAWIAMGLQESPLAPGWYNSYVTEVYTQANGNPSVVKALAKNAIQERTAHFMRHPKDALRFFSHKEITQWADPTFESLWTAFGSIKNEELSKDSLLQQSFHHGLLRNIYILWCDIIQSIIYIGAAITLIMCRKHWQPQQLELLLIFIGGFIFHTIWEAKSDYVLSYFILLLPYSAAGLHVLRFKHHTSPDICIA